MGKPYAIDLPHRVKDYAYKLISVHVKQEYESQISEWTTHITNIVA